MTEPIASPDDLDAELERLARIGGTPADFEAAVAELAGRLERAVTCRSLLRIARVGWTSYNGLPDVPGGELAEFLGRPWAELPQVPRRRDPGGARRERVPGESVPEYVGSLGESLFADLGYGDDDAARRSVGQPPATSRSWLSPGCASWSAGSGPWMPMPWAC